MDRPSEMAPLTFVDGAYRTAPGDRSPVARLFPSLSFYTRYVHLIYSGARSARRGTYKDEDWSRTSLGLLRGLEAVGVRLEVTGTEHFSRLQGPCVFVGNHMSTLEAAVLPTIIQPLKKVTFIVKRSLVEYPIFGHIMRSRDPIVVGRTNARDDLKAVIEGGAARLGAGISIVVFPQTTRTVIFDPAEFNSIGIKLAKRAQVPVVPLALKTDAWANGSLVKDFGKIAPAKTAHFAFGAPLSIHGTGSGEHQQVVEFIRGNLLAWGGTVANAPAPAAG